MGMPILYRVRKDENIENKNDPNSFSYIQNPKFIKRQRFNKDGEQVLYTSTYPNVAVEETLENYHGNFYIGKWKGNNQNRKFNAFVALDENCSKDPKARSRIYREEMKTHLSKEELDRIDFFRNILEKDYTNYPKDLQYDESSELASKILEVADCILSYSAKDNRELNISFNKKATDEFLFLEYVYYCFPMKDMNKMCYDVQKVGIVENGEINWYNWEVDMDTLVCHDNLYDFNPRQYLENNIYARLHKYVNINNDLDGLHTGYISYQSEKFLVDYKIQLIPLDNE